MRHPPQPPLRFAGITPPTLVAETESVLQSFLALQDRLVATITPSTATFGNLVRPLLDEVNHVKYQTNALVFLARASPDAQIRQVARDANQDVTDATDRCWLRPDLAALVSAVSSSPELDDEDRAVLDHVRGMFACSGASLQDDAKRARIEEAQAEIRALNAAAVKCFTESGTDEGLWFTRTELAGCPETWLTTLKQEGDRLFVPHRGESYMKVLRSAASEDTRRTLFLARQRLYPENVERLARVVCLRDEVARLLGFENHAALKMQETMMKSVDGLQEKLTTLQAKLKPLAESEIARLVELKRAEQAEQKRSGDNLTLYTWDRLYYTNLQMKTDYAIDQARVAEYFEANHVLLEMLKIFEDLFGMVFVPMPELETWYHTVSSFGVWNGVAEGGDFLGYLYIDIFERPGKFSNQYHSRIQPGYFDVNGKRHFPVSALFCSYPESTPERPSLLSHRDVRIVFHELGHAIHHLVERTKYGLGQSRDFGEIPSKMLEHFVWLPEVLVRLSKHVSSLPGFASSAVERHDDPKLPLDLAHALERSQTLNLAIGLLNLMQGAIFDLTIYTPKNAEEAFTTDTTAIWNQTRKQLPFKDGDAEGEGLFGQASFSLAFRGYDANYFTYVMSEVYAADLFETAFAKDPLSPEAGRKWRYQVLERGSSQPELEMLERFLGRPLHLDAIIEQIVRGQKM